jgi:hypothetical protein
MREMEMRRLGDKGEETKGKKGMRGDGGERK